MVVLHGLQICWENEFKIITCFLDLFQIVNLISGKEFLFITSLQMKFLVFVNFLLEIGRLWLIIRSERPGNVCVNVLANMGAL
jgi:hypothetical protein